MKQRNFVVGVAFSKTDALQVALFATLFLRALPGWVTLRAIGLATAGVVLLSIRQKAAADARCRTGRAGAGRRRRAVAAALTRQKARPRRRGAC